jgi:hypothetical protein
MSSQLEVNEVSFTFYITPHVSPLFPIACRFAFPCFGFEVSAINPNTIVLVTKQVLWFGGRTTLHNR